MLLPRYGTLDAVQQRFANAAKRLVDRICRAVQLCRNLLHRGAGTTAPEEQLAIRARNFARQSANA